MKLSLLALVSTAFAAAVSVSHRETQLEAGKFHFDRPVPFR